MFRTRFVPRHGRRWKSAAQDLGRGYLAAVRTFHVTSSLNRASITKHGLDWARMAASCGIAGSSAPEAEGVFLCRDELEADWFVRMNNTGGPVDVWAVEGVDLRTLVDNGNGFGYLPEKVPASRLTLLRKDMPPPTDLWR